MNFGQKILIILLIYSTQTNSQSIQEYNRIIDTSEFLIVNSKFDSAYIYYLRAFYLNQNPFAQDLYNSCVCAILSGQPDQDIFMLIKRLAVKGVPITFFKKKAIFLTIRERPIWDTIKLAYSNWQDEYLSKVNTELRNELVRLEEKDQFLRLQDPNYEVFADSIKKEDDKIFQQLLYLIKNNNAFSEANIGIRIAEDTILIEQPYHVIIRHIYQNGNFELTNTLLEWVSYGYIKPEEFMTWHEFELAQKGESYGVNPIIKIGEKFYEKTYPGIHKILDSNRNKIGVKSINIEKKLINYKNTNKSNLFFISLYSGLAIWDINQEQIDKLFPIIKKI